jgi:2-polyprenyl-3-methyl-5-hydroxy-6-metoxy-1,4-benzoquinol methylase
MEEKKTDKETHKATIKEPTNEPGKTEKSMEMKPIPIPVDVGVNPGVAKYVGTNQVILSVGCGGARLEEYAKRRNNTVYGIDISKEDVEHAKKILDGAYLCDLSKAKKLPFKKETFDVILMGDILEHFLEPQDILNLIKPYLKKDGYIVASIPNVANWTVRFPLLFGKFRYGEDGIVVWQHYRYFTEKTTRELIEGADYEIKKMDYTTSLINVTYDFVKGILGKPKPQDIRLKSIEESNKEKRASPSKKRGIKSLVKKTLEGMDYHLTKTFSGLLAFQFIIVAKKRDK